MNDAAESTGPLPDPAQDWIYKILTAEEWASLTNAGEFAGSVDDQRDGFIHLSAADQVSGTLARHFSGQANLKLLAVDPQRVGDTLKWEVSRGGKPFPHLYGPLPQAAVVAWRTVDAVPDTDRNAAD